MSTTTGTAVRPTATDPDPRYRRLRGYNMAMGVLHALQAAAVLALATDFSLPVTASYWVAEPGTARQPTTELFRVSTAYGVAAFLVVSAVAHFLIAAPRIFDWYCANLGRTRNYARWIEYSISSSIMIVLIAQLTGITDVAALGALFGVNASMILFGLLQEHYEAPGSRGWLPFLFGCFAGIVPWLVIAVYLASPGGNAAPPGFVYAIFVSLFVFFNAFAVNQWLQYRRVGPWRNYLVGESAYVLLSLVAKSALAWQVFGGTLAT